MPSLLTVVCDNLAAENFSSEHGLALCLQNDSGTTWFDTGSGATLLKNAAALGLPPGKCDRLILSHGHSDHTGGIPFFPAGTTVFCGEKVDSPCYSLHADGSVHPLTMPEAGRERLRECRVCVVASFTEIAPGMFLSGKIGRAFPASSGGHFFSDLGCTVENTTREEVFLYLTGGVMITGCCHAGLQNCVAALRRKFPAAPLHTVIGGMHWLDLTENALLETAHFLETLKLKQLVLLHCTGEAAMQFMKRRLPEMVAIGRAGESFPL